MELRGAEKFLRGINGAACAVTTNRYGCVSNSSGPSFSNAVTRYPAIAQANAIGCRATPAFSIAAGNQQCSTNSVTGNSHAITILRRHSINAVEHSGAPTIQRCGGADAPATKTAAGIL